MDIDYPQLRLKRYRKDLRLERLTNVFEEYCYNVHVFAILHVDFGTKPKVTIKKTVVFSALYKLRNRVDRSEKSVINDLLYVYR